MFFFINTIQFDGTHATTRSWIRQMFENIFFFCWNRKNIVCVAERYRDADPKRNKANGKNISENMRLYFATCLCLLNGFAYRISFGIFRQEIKILKLSRDRKRLLTIFYCHTWFVYYTMYTYICLCFDFNVFFSFCRKKIYHPNKEWWMFRNKQIKCNIFAATTRIFLVVRHTQSFIKRMCFSVFITHFSCLRNGNICEEYI